MENPPDDGTLYIVAAKVGGREEGEKHHGCRIFKASDLIAGIYYQAYGPDTHDKCELWMQDNCGII